MPVSLTPAAVRCEHDDRGDGVASPAGEQRQACPGRFETGRLVENAAADGDDGVGGQHESTRRGAGRGFGARQPDGRQAGRLRRMRGLIDVGRDHGVGDDADLGQQCEATGAGGGEDEPGRRRGVGHLNRKVIRPLDKS
jgi:hypothetical protein